MFPHPLLNCQFEVNLVRSVSLCAYTYIFFAFINVYFFLLALSLLIQTKYDSNVMLYLLNILFILDNT
jgi:hypothetical protein